MINQPLDRSDLIDPPNAISWRFKLIRQTAMTNDCIQPTDFAFRCLSISEFCHWSGLSKTKVYELIEHGDLQARKCGRRTLITNEEAHRWWDSLPSMCPAFNKGAGHRTAALRGLPGRQHRPPVRSKA